MCSTHTTIPKTHWHQLGFGAHVCSIYSGEKEQFSPLIPFFTEGFKNHEQCVYIEDTHTPEEIAAQIHTDIAHTEGASEASLEVFSYHETYIKDGAFNAEKMIALLKTKIAEATEAGYTGVRAAGEMTWALSSDTPLDELLKYEQELNSFLPSQKLTGICLFNEEKFSPEFLIEIIRTHPFLIVHGKLYENKYFYIHPEFVDESQHLFKSHDYQTILSIITDETPLVA